MSLFTTWKRNKKPKTKEKEKPALDLKKPPAEGEEDFELPPSLSRNRDRNLSMSRSGRYKMKKRERSSVMSDEVYSPDAEEAPGSSGKPAWPETRKPAAHSASTPAHAHSTAQSNSKPRAPSGCRDPVDSSANAHSLSGSQRMARAPTAV